MNSLKKISVPVPCRTVILALAWFWTLSASPAATEWIESVYLVGTPAVSTEFPRPKDTWKLHLKQKICIGKKNSSFELLHGPGENVKRWLIGDYAIVINPDHSANIYPKGILQEMNAMGSLPETGWTKGLEPVRTLKSGDGEILVFEKTGRVAWVAKDSGQLLAAADGRTVTLFENSKSNAPEPVPSAREMEAINAAFEAQKKAGQYWKLPG